MTSKVVILLLLVGVMLSGCLAEHSRGLLGIGLGGVYGQEQRHRVEKGKSIEGYKEGTVVKYPKRSVDNHHSIPRQYYGDPDDGNGTP